MAYDKRFGIEIPTERKQVKQWSVDQHIEALQQKVAYCYAQKGMAWWSLGLKHLSELHKLRKFYDAPTHATTNNVMIVPRARSDEEWEQDAKQHRGVFLERATAHLNDSLATDSGIKAGDTEQSRDSD